MKQHSQIVFFLISLFSFFFMGNVLYTNDISSQLDASSENLVIEEEREVSVAFLEITDEIPEISGGHPDTISNTTSTAISQVAVAIFSAQDIKSKYIPESFYLGKLALYLRYQALRLHC